MLVFPKAENGNQVTVYRTWAIEGARWVALLNASAGSVRAVVNGTNDGVDLYDYGDVTTTPLPDDCVITYNIGQAQVVGTLLEYLAARIADNEV